MAADLTNTVLDGMQSGFPLEADPYAVLAQRFGTEADAVRQVVAALYESGQVRRIGASFDSRKLGYASTLCALAVPGGEEDLIRAAEAVSAFPGVTHNYGRAHRYNLWFTLITRSQEEKTAILSDICAQTGCSDLLDMPSTKKFKISVDFGKQKAAQGGSSAALKQGRAEEAPAARTAMRTASAEQLEARVRPFQAEDAFDVELVRWAQGDIARDSEGTMFNEPYVRGAAHIAAQLGREDITAEMLLERLRELKASKTIRRFGAMVRHHKIGFAFNSMTVWDIADDEVDQAGKLFAQAPFVSHCYTRPRAATWPANLYAMCHARTEGELQAHIDTLKHMLATGGIACNEHFALNTTHEFKKVSMTYFTE